jgi:DoxX-like family
MFVATAILSGLLALLFTAASLGKVRREQRQVDTAEKLKIPWARYRLIAAPEAAGAIGLLVGLKVAPLGVAAAAGLVALMAGAVFFRARVHDANPLIAGDATVMVIAGVTAVLRTVTA